MTHHAPTDFLAVQSSSWRALLLLALLAGLLLPATALPAGAQSTAALANPEKRGEYVFQLAGGCGCHTDKPSKGPFMGGDRPIKTPFGTIYSTNITPDPDTGLGGWSDADFIQAMRQGVGPDGVHFFPVFPFTSFTGMTDGDLRDLKAYLDTLPPVRKTARKPDFMPPFGWRIGLVPWKYLFFQPQRFTPDPARSGQWNRGAYISTAVAHCAECHTPRNLAGGLKREMWMAGSAEGPEGELAPNITPHVRTGIGSWDEGDLVWFLQSGLKPDGDDAQGLMWEVIDNGYKHLTEDDLKAIATYFLSLPPIENQVRRSN